MGFVMSVAKILKIFDFQGTHARANLVRDFGLSKVANIIGIKIHAHVADFYRGFIIKMLCILN